MGSSSNFFKVFVAFYYNTQLEDSGVDTCSTYFSEVLFIEAGIYNILLIIFHTSALHFLLPLPPNKMLKKAMVGIAIVGLNAVDAYSLQKRDGAHAHDHGHAAPAPSSGYEEPASSYGAPAASYGAPAASYGAPSASYGEPAYEAAPSYGAEEAALPDLTPIII